MLSWYLLATIGLRWHHRLVRLRLHTSILSVCLVHIFPSHCHATLQYCIATVQMQYKKNYWGNTHMHQIFRQPESSKLAYIVELTDIQKYIPGKTMMFITKGYLFLFFLLGTMFLEAESQLPGTGNVNTHLWCKECEMNCIDYSYLLYSLCIWSWHAFSTKVTAVVKSVIFVATISPPMNIVAIRLFLENVHS